VARALIVLGGGPKDADFERGEVSFMREYYQGFCAALEKIDSFSLRCLNSPREVATMFDKWACHEIFVGRVVARPPAERAPRSFEELFTDMRSQKRGRVFLKPLYGSSASGVCALCWEGDRLQLVTPLRIVQGKRGGTILVNSLVVERYRSPKEIELILNQLLREGMLMERWIPKLTLSRGAIDLRILVIAGEARHWVIRESSSPMTNLHLGNSRGDAGELIATIGEAKLEAAFRLAEQAAACFPDSLYAGVDILLDHAQRALVAEINAFGDLLPRLAHRGESAYAAIARAYYDQGCIV
jgi:glutathione synthase/RimK-type ligase-like ATP-grasp enzyme